MSELDWTFDGTWPHSPHWFESGDGKMHFVDTGDRDGLPVVLLHGNPSWGYLYRNFIPALVSAGYRVVVPDHLGFGRSDKPDDAAIYTVERHAERLDALLESLDLRDVTIGVHDWGGPIGLAWATQHSERIRSLVVFNYFAHRPVGPVSLALPLRLFRVWGVGEWMVKGLHLVLRGFLFGAGIMDKTRLTKIVRAAYQAPHRNWSSRTALLVFARQFPGDARGVVAEWIERVHQGFGALASRPVFIAWAGKDAVFSEGALQRWLTDFPSAELLRLPNTGHFLQEDAHEQVIPSLLDFLHRARRTV